MSVVSSVLSRAPFLLQKVALRALYLLKGKVLQDVVRFNDGQFYAYKVNGHYVPSAALNWFLDFEHYQQRLKSMSAWAYTPDAGDTVMDIGAGMGEETIVLSRLVGPSGRVIAVEANPEAFDVLQQVVRLNGLTNVEAHMLAINATDAPVQIDICPNYLAGSLGSSGGRRYNVPGVRMDSFLRAQHVDRIDLLKVNIEGAERFVVGTMGEFAARVHHFAIECHDFRAEAEGNPFFRTRQLVEDFLRANGRRPCTNAAWVYA